MIIHWRRAAELGCGALCFEGNIDFMGRVDSGGKRVWYPLSWIARGEDASFFLCKSLYLVILMRLLEYATPEGYLVDEQDAEEFDKQTSAKVSCLCVII